MAALRNFTLAARRSPFIAPQFTRCAGYHATSTRFAGKESALGHEGRAEEIEKEKQAQLQKQKDGKGEWHEGLASDSESIVKADRGEVEASEQTIKELQKEAEKVAHKK